MPSSRNHLSQPFDCAGNKVLSQGWEVRTDPSSGQEYYVNRHTGESQWDPPDGLFAEEEWEERVDPASGSAYYYNNATSETTWHRPSTLTASDSAAAAGGTAGAGGGAGGGTGWEQLYDESSGHYYYRNLATQETTWDRPAEMGPAGDGTTAAAEAPGAPELAAAAPEPAAAAGI